MKKKSKDDESLYQSIRITELETTNRVLQEKLKLLKIQLESHIQFKNATRYQTKKTLLTKSNANLSSSRKFHSTFVLQNLDHSRPITAGKSYDCLDQQIKYLHEELENVKNQNKVNILDLKNKLQTGEETFDMEKLETEVNENIELIKLKRIMKKQTAEIQSLQTQLDMAHEEIKQQLSNVSKIVNEKDELRHELTQEKTECVKVKTEIGTLKESIKLLEEQLNDVQVEKATLKDHNENLLQLSLRNCDNTNDEQRKNFIKKIREMEENQKRELATKGELITKISDVEIINVELRNKLSRNEYALEDIKSKYSALQSEFEHMQMKISSNISNNSKQSKQTVDKMTMVEFEDSSKKLKIPILELDDDDEENLDLKLKCVKSIHELNQLKELLRVQYNINNTQKQQIEELQISHKKMNNTEIQMKKIQYMINNHLQQLYHILLSIDFKNEGIDVAIGGALNLSKDNDTLFEPFDKIDELLNTYTQYLNRYIASNVSQNQKSRINVKDMKAVNVSNKSIQTELDSIAVPTISELNVDSAKNVVFTLHIKKVVFSFLSDHLMKSSNNNPKVFLTWNFLNDNENQAYTPTISIDQGVFNCSCQYEGLWSSFLNDYLRDHGICVEIHFVQDDISVRLAETIIETSSALDMVNSLVEYNSKFKNDNIEGNVIGEYVLKYISDID